ncbi:JmjC domain-containing protein [Streptomyces sp. NPDC087851]|uniref:JmjC domain-containing protein n=1 Tax=Streptomyces sp. NPDC087851 TaxID=3365810 RepID=UPI003805FD77
MNSQTHQETAAKIIAPLWSAALPSYRADGAQVSHLRHLFETEWTAGLPLPLAEHRPVDQTVALADEANFHRETDESRLDIAYRQRPRTRVYESIDVRSDGWYSLVAARMASLTRRRVICTMYESNAADQNIGAHFDLWFGVIIQMRGAKTWKIRKSPRGDTEEIVTRAGDVLLLPPHVQHDVATPEYSVHLVFAITGNPMATNTLSGKSA